MTYDQMWKLLEAIQGQIRAFDNKAQVLLGVNGVLAGFITAELVKAAEYSAGDMPKCLVTLFVVLGAALLADAASFGNSLLVINPQLHLQQPRSKLFFCHLAEEYDKDFTRAVEDFMAFPEEDAKRDIGAQIQTNALVCTAKSARCRVAMRCTGCALLMYAVSIPVFVSMASSAATRSAGLHNVAPPPCARP